MQSGRFVFFMMMVHPDQSDPECKYSCTTCRECIQLPLYVYGIDAIINNQMLKISHILLVHLSALKNGRNLGIDTLNKEKGDILSEFCTDIFRENFRRFVNEVLFKIKKNRPEGYIFGRNNSQQHCKMRYPHVGKCTTTKRLRLWSISR